MEQQTKKVRLIVSGRVQGVAFRYNTLQEARELNLAGWVKNLRDGGVEILAQGPSKRVDRLVEWAHHGPRMARVDNVCVVEERRWPETNVAGVRQASQPADRGPQIPSSFEIRY